MADRPPQAGAQQPGHAHNRRAFPRWRTDFEVRYGDGGGTRDARGYQIGQAGLSFWAEEPLDLDREIEVAYRLAPDDDWTQVKALVRNCCEGRVGAEFLNIRRADRLRILDFIVAHPEQTV